MTVYCLTDAQKDLIASWYKQKLFNQKQLAKQYQVSERTINRVLEEKGLATPVARIKGEAYQVMQVLKGYNMNVEQLKAALAAPALTMDNVQRFLNTCSKEQLAALFYTSGLVKIAEMVPTKARQSEQGAVHAAVSQ